MVDETKKLEEDLKILEQMIDDMPAYLDSDALFWQKVDKTVEPTIGGFLLRQHRLLALRDPLLSQGQQARLNQAVSRFAKMAEHPRLEPKAGQELEARLRQWETMLMEQLADEFPSPAYYRADVEIRAIIQSLVDLAFLTNAPAVTRLTKLDNKLKERWQTGSFVWVKAWKPAYPQQKYWWLYGKLTPV